ncbi:hypothetical protein ACT53J_05885 [Citrobacter braakii]|uniref:hypothetical protein n=1 Tax=Citrobacter braakii TaxID=57706 RepID=UPI004033BEFE
MTEQTSRLAIIIDSTRAKNNADSLTSALVKMTRAGENAATGAKKLTKATDEEKSALAELLDQIDPLNAALNKLDKQQQQLAKFKSKGMLDDETFANYSLKIDEARTKQEAQPHTFEWNQWGRFHGPARTGSDGGESVWCEGNAGLE